nr:CoA transferase [Comamonas serinivorans]
MAPSTVLGDVAGGALYLAIGLLAGLHHARATGQGQVADAAIVDGCAHMLNLLLGALQRRGTGFERQEAAHWAGRSYRCQDGGWINVAPLEPKFYAEMLVRLGLDRDERFVQGQNDPARWPELTEVLTRLMASRTRAEWEAVFAGSDACWAPVLNPHEAALHAHLAERDTYRSPLGVLQSAPAPRFSVSEAEMGTVAAAGAHSDTLLRTLGFSPTELKQLLSA